MKLLENRGTSRSERATCCGLQWKRLPELDLRCVVSHDPQRGLLQKKTKEGGGRKRRKEGEEEEKNEEEEGEKEEEGEVGGGRGRGRRGLGE